MIMDDPYLWVIPQCRQGILTVFILKSVDVTHVVGLSPLVHFHFECVIDFFYSHSKANFGILRTQPYHTGPSKPRVSSIVISPCPLMIHQWINPQWSPWVNLKANSSKVSEADFVSDGMCHGCPCSAAAWRGTAGGFQGAERGPFPPCAWGGGRHILTINNRDFREKKWRYFISPCEMKGGVCNVGVWHQYVALQ